MQEPVPFVEQVAAPVSRFNLVLDHVRNRGLANLTGEIRAFGRPIAEVGPEAVTPSTFMRRSTNSKAVTENGWPDFPTGKDEIAVTGSVAPLRSHRRLCRTNIRSA